MAFLDNTGLARLWEHIVARFANREDVEIISKSVNILDNSNFAKAIIRRSDFARSSNIIIDTGGSGGSYGSAGGSTTNTMRYIIDRWRTSSSITHEQGAGLVIPQGSTHYFRQGIELNTFENAIYTVVITLYDGTKHGGTIDLASSNIGSYTDDLFDIVMTKNYEDTYDKIDITVNNTGRTFAISNIGLYQGTFSTLPDYIAKTRQEEQLRAARYFKSFEGTGVCARCTSGALQAKYHFEVPFRATNYDLIILETGSVYGNNKTPNGVAVTGITFNSRSVHSVLLTVSTGTNTLTSNETGAWYGGSIGLDADYT